MTTFFSKGSHSRYPLISRGYPKNTIFRDLASNLVHSPASMCTYAVHPITLRWLSPILLLDHFSSRISPSNLV